MDLDPGQLVRRRERSVFRRGRQLGHFGPIDLVGLFSLNRRRLGGLRCFCRGRGQSGGGRRLRLRKRHWVAHLPGHRQGFERLGLFDLRGYRVADVQRPAGFGRLAHAQRRDLGIRCVRDLGRRRGTVHVARLQHCGRCGLFADGRFHHLFEGLFGWLLVILGPMVVGHGRVIAFRRVAAGIAQLVCAAHRVAEQVKSAHSQSGVPGQAEQDGQFGGTTGRSLEPRGDENQQCRRSRQAGKLRVTVQNQPVLVEIAVYDDDHAQDSYQDYRRADDRPELFVDTGRLGPDA